ncbi:MAG: gluconolactonase [Burkholderiales bacterium PBB5]|nr:MAG: gluconolactonase [Burkholderiales bacterium PBB5]
MTLPSITALPVAPALLGESPLWHPDEQRLYWVDIPGRQLHQFEPRSGAHRQWAFDTEPACCVPVLGGGLLLAMRDGLWRFDPASGQRQRVAAPPYPTAEQRYNDGKADAQGRFWVGTLDDQRRPLAALYRFDDGQTRRMVEGISVSNGLAFSPDGRTLYWADTKAHAIDAFDVDASDGSLSRRRPFARFAPRTEGQPLTSYGGRPDGAAVDSEGAYWVAMYEGQRLLRLSPEGALLQDLPLPVRCPTMPCLGGDDYRTLYITTARNGRPAEELAAQPLAGCVLQLRVDVPGLPAHLARL